jgi:hypothetical protein
MSRRGIVVSCCASLLAVFASHAIFQALRVPGFVFMLLPEFQTANALEIVKEDGGARTCGCNQSLPALLNFI